MESNCGIAHNRNQIVQDFLKTAFTHLWMVDSDVVPPRKALKSPHRCVSGVYHHYVGNPPGIVYNTWLRGPEGYKPGLQLPSKPEPVDAVGAGCLLLERSLLEEMESPWFEDHFEDNKLSLGEDFDFCEKLAALGEKVWIEPRFICQHMKTISLSAAEEGVYNVIRARLA